MRKDSKELVSLLDGSGWVTYCPGEADVAERDEVAAIAEERGYWVSDYVTGDNGPVISLRRR